MTQHNQKQVLSLLSLLKTFTCVSDKSWARFIYFFNTLETDTLR